MSVPIFARYQYALLVLALIVISISSSCVEAESARRESVAVSTRTPTLHANPTWEPCSHAAEAAIDNKNPPTMRAFVLRPGGATVHFPKARIVGHKYSNEVRLRLQEITVVGTEVRAIYSLEHEVGYTSDAKLLFCTEADEYSYFYAKEPYQAVINHSNGATVSISMEQDPGATWCL